MNFEELGRKVKKLSRDTVEEVQKMNEVRRLTGRMNEAQKQIRALYGEMGKKLYEQYKEEALAGFESEIHAISDKYARIAELKEQIRNVKGVVLCPCCNMEVPATERFCSNCGNKMPEVFEIVGEDEAADAVVVESEDVTQKTEDMAQEAVTGDAAQEAVAEDMAQETVTGDVMQETAAEDMAQEAVTGDVMQEAVAEDAVQEAVAEDMAQEAVTGDATQEAVAEDIAQEVVAGDISATATEAEVESGTTENTVEAGNAEDVQEARKEEAAGI